MNIKVPVPEFVHYHLIFLNIINNRFQYKQYRNYPAHRCNKHLYLFLQVSLLNLTTRCGQRFVRAISETSNEPGFHETLCSTISDKAEIAVYFKKQLQAFMTGVRLEQIQAASELFILMNKYSVAI